MDLYKVFDISFDLITIFKDTINDKTLRFKKRLTFNDVKVSLEPSVISNKNISEYVYDDIFNYCKYNFVQQEALVLYSYEIEHEFNNVDIYFSVTQSEEFELAPLVCVKYNPLCNNVLLNVEQISNDTVMWSWEWSDNNDFFSNIVNFETENIISTLPIGINYFIETGLSVGDTITRYVIVDNGCESKESHPVTFVLSHIEDTSYAPYKKEERNEKYELENTNKVSRLKAFQSGVGDFNDCKIYKADVENYERDFKLINEIYGIRASRDTKYAAVKFFYRFIAKGLIDYYGYKGGFDITVTASTIRDRADNTGPFYTGKINNFSVTKRIDFSDEHHHIELNMCDLFAELFKTHNLRDYKHYRAKFDISMTNITGTMRVYTREHGVSNIIDVNNATLNFSLHTFFDSTIRVVSLPTIKQKEFISKVPIEGKEPFVGVVNGDFEVNSAGIKDYVTSMPLMKLPDNVHSIKYYCEIYDDLTTPSGATVQYVFENQEDGEDYTLVNGDTCKFFSPNIFEDASEYSEFITQFEKGVYTIKDSQEHEYSYTINISNINASDYKRLEYKVISNNNDINIKDVIVEENLDEQIVNIKVIVRVLQHAISMWNPYIHSGYYYLNNEERYLYTKCAMDFNSVDTLEYIMKDIINVRMFVYVKNPTGTYQMYENRLRKREDLLLNSKEFLFYDGYIYPKPYRIIDGIGEYKEKYVYYTKPIVTDYTPTSIKEISWSQYAENGASVKAYAITFDDINGMWRDPVEIKLGEGIPSNLIPSKIMMLKFELMPSLNPSKVTEQFRIECATHFEEHMNKQLSSNCTYKKEILTPISHKTDGIYISKVYNLGTSNAVSENLLNRGLQLDLKYNSSKVNLYYQTYDRYEHIGENLYHNDWVKVREGHRVIVKQYTRFKIEIIGEEKDYLGISYVLVTLDRYKHEELEYKDFLPGVGNIYVRQEYNPKNSSKVIQYDIVEKINFDLKPNIIVENVSTLVRNLGEDSGFVVSDVTGINFEKLGEHRSEYDLLYEYESDDIVKDSPLVAISRQKLYDTKMLDTNYDGIDLKPNRNKVILNPIPQQCAPVVVYKVDDDVIFTPLKRVFFTTEFGDYTLVNDENIISKGFKTFYLQEHDIDKSSAILRINGELNFDFEIDGNILKLQVDTKEGDDIHIRYKIRNSFIVNYTNTGEAILEVNGINENELINKIRVFYETDFNTNLRKLEHISLNPIYNPLYKGFLYISNLHQEPFAVKVVPMSDYIHANGINKTTILVIVEDKYQNPIQNIKVNTVCAFGSLDENIKTTDINGIASYTYTSYTDNVIDEIRAVATDFAHGVATITNRKINQVKE